MTPKGKQRFLKMVLAISSILLLVMFIVFILFLKQTKVDPIVTPPLEKSAWIVDWQWEQGMDDLKQVVEGLSSLQIFAAYFDRHDRLYFTQGYEEGMSGRLKEVSHPAVRYLTIVNDVWQDDGTAIQKDPDLISRIVADEQSRRQHVSEVAQTAIDADYAGIELDYERIKQSDWDGYIALIDTLYTELKKVNKSLRIVLEPRAPLEQLAFPEGPEYVMMAYNLYGYHSSAGPKTDHHFLEQLTTRMNHVPGDATIALSAGGFDWAENGDIKAVTEQQAWQIATQTGATPDRDEASDSLYFDYVDDSGINHEVWFADGTTFSRWTETLKKAGYYRIAFWRLGGLGEETLRFIREVE